MQYTEAHRSGTPRSRRLQSRFGPREGARRTDPKSSGLGRVIIVVYGIFSLSAGVRSLYQILTQFDVAPLAYLLSLFSAGHTYTEPEVNDVLRPVVEDWAFWRRELVEYGYLQRDAGRYWLPEEVPERTANMQQEAPAWEALWLPTHLRDRRA